jgi:hypothetical protein
MAIAIRVATTAALVIRIPLLRVIPIFGRIRLMQINEIAVETVDISKSTDAITPEFM